MSEHQPDAPAVPVSEAAVDEPAWTPEQIAEFKVRFEAAMAKYAPLRVLPSEHWKDRAEAAEAKLAEIAAGCREAIDRNASQGVTLVSAAYILGMAEGGSEKEPRDG